MIEQHLKDLEVNANKVVDNDLFDEAAWLTLHASLLQDAEYLQMATSDFARHASTLVGMLAELQKHRKRFLEEADRSYD